MDHLESYRVDITIDRFDGDTPVWGSGIQGLTVSQLEPIGNCELTPGDPSPVGRCPQTGDLVYLDRPSDKIREHAQEMFDLLADLLTPGAISAAVLAEGRDLLAKLGADVTEAGPSAAAKVIADHVFSFQTDFLESLAADTADDKVPPRVQSISDKARALLAARFDYEAAAAAEGWSIGPDDSNDGTFGYEGKGKFARNISTRTEAARICCELNGIVASPIPTEHWSVSSVLAALLISRGETVDPSFPGMPIWARTARGHLRQDPILLAIAKDL